MTTETVTLQVQRYRDPLGKPTCCASVRAGQTCRWLQTIKLGTVHVCNVQGALVELEREGGNGYLMPWNECPLWQGEDDAS